MIELIAIVALSGTSGLGLAYGWTQRQEKRRIVGQLNHVASQWGIEVESD